MRFRRGFGEVDESFRPGSSNNWVRRKGEAPDVAEISRAIEVQPQFESEEGRFRTARLDSDRRHDCRPVRTPQEKADDLLRPEGTLSPPQVVYQANLAEAEGHGARACVHDPDQQWQDIVSESRGAMAPGMGGDGNAHICYLLADRLPFPIDLSGWVGQRAKVRAPAGLEQQQQDQDAPLMEHVSKVSCRF